MIEHPLRHINGMLQEQIVAVGKARNAYLAKKAEKRNLEATLKKLAEGTSQSEKAMNADATDIWLNFERDLNRLESVYDFEKDKLEVMNKEYLAQYLELKDNGLAIRRGME